MKDHLNYSSKIGVATKRDIKGFLYLLFTLLFGVAFPQAEKMKDSSETTMKLFLAGDVMTGRGIDQALPHSVPPVLYESYVKDARDYIQIAERENGNIKTPLSYEYVWGDALGVWKNEAPDVKLVNLETSITTYDEPWARKGIHYRMHPRNVQLLTTAGIDHVSLANNHMLDWSRPGLKQTMSALGSARIPFSGAGMNATEAGKPSVLQQGEKRILIFSYGAPNSGFPPTWAADKDQSGVNYLSGFGKDGIEKVKKEIRSYKKPGDLVIFSIHWGGNWGYTIPGEHKNFAHELIDEAGVDLIFGHSSHHPLGLEVYNNKLILYGAGDFINDYEGIRGHDQYRPELSLMYFPELDMENGNLHSLKMMPMEIKRFSLNHASKEQGNWLKDVLTREGKEFGTGVSSNENGALWLEWE